MTVVEFAAAAAAALLAVAAAFQVSLALGVPLGEATMGGRARTIDGVLTGGYRGLAVASAVLILLAAWITLARADLLAIFVDRPVLMWATWVVAAFMAMNTATNLSGRHPLEKWGLATITLLAAVLVGYVAVAAPR